MKTNKNVYIDKLKLKPKYEKTFKKIGIGIGIIGLVVLLVWKINSKDTSTTIFILKDIKNNYDISYTIDTPRGAVEYLKMMKKLDVKKLEDIEVQAKTKIVIAVRTKDIKGIKDWIVLIKTENIIPSFSCQYAVNMFPSKDDKTIIKKCGWNK
jgi:hypothetical protein